MPIKILMPALSPTMEEGTLAKWLVKEGDKVKSGDIIAEIETDKATMEFEAIDEGTMGAILVTEGSEGVKVNTPIAVLLEEGDDINSTSHPATVKASPTLENSTLEKTTISVLSTTPKTQHRHENLERRIFATPLARRIAADKGFDLATVKGSGPRGRIVKADVEDISAVTTKPASRPAAETASIPLTQSANATSVAHMYDGREYIEVPLYGMRKTIAARLTDAKQTIPHFYLRRNIKLDALLNLRAELNGQLKGRGVKLSVNDFIIKSCALALQSVPDANAVWAGDRILKLAASDVAVAVAIEGGLFTPVIQDAETKPLSNLSAEMKDLANRARERKLAPHEYQGGSFAISNLGMFGIDNFDAVINPPHGAILAVGAGVKKPVVGKEGTLEVATVLSVTLSVDHRVIDGTLGAKLLNSIVENLENPISMLV